MKFPVLTFAIAMSAVAVACSGPNLWSALVYDRTRIESGDLWRVVTCNWIHFSKAHLTYDLLAFALAGSLMELRNHRGLGTFCLISPALIGLTVFLTRPDILIFGGLSGLATGAMVLLSLHGLRDRTAWRSICALMLIAMGVKTIFEFVTGHPAFVAGGTIAIQVVPESHVAGALTAGMVWCKEILVPAQDLNLKPFQAS